MRNWSFGILALAALASPPARSDDEGIQWLGNYQEAVRQARETGKPIFLEFRCEP